MEPFDATVVDSKPMLLAEFSAMRSEITTFVTLQVQFLSASVVLGGVLVGLAVNKWSPFRESLDIVPIPFLLLAMLYADTKARVLRAACYIDDKLRPRLVAAGLPEALQWEEYIRQEYPARKHLEIMDRLRWLIFLFPALVTLFLSIGIPPTSEVQKSFFPIVFCIDLALLCFVVWTISKL